MRCAAESQRPGHFGFEGQAQPVKTIVRREFPGSAAQADKTMQVSFRRFIAGEDFDFCFGKIT